MSALVNVAPACVQATLGVLASNGRLGLEGSALWLGSTSDLRVQTVVVPAGPGVSFEPKRVQLSVQWMDALGAFCDEIGQVVLAGVHSHPWTAFHSEVDNDGFLHAPDFVSIVVPRYGVTDLAEAKSEWAVYVGLPNGRWRSSSWSLAVELDPTASFETRVVTVGGLTDART